MINDVLQQAIELEVGNRVSEIKYNYEKAVEKIEKLNNDKKELVIQCKELQSKLKLENSIASFVDLINENTIDTIILSNIGWNKRDIDFSGMNSEYIPKWFKLLCQYYDNKKELLEFFNVFNIKFDNYAYNFKLPSDYSKEELLMVLDNAFKLYVCNGQIFGGNMGFYWREFRKHNFNLEDVLRKESYAEIPFQILLSNPNFKEKEVFNKLIEVLNKKTSHHEYFYNILEYQDFPYEMTLTILDTVNNDNYTYYKNAIKRIPNVLKVEKYAEKFKDKISESRYSEFYYNNYPKSHQVAFIKDKGNHRNFEDVVKLITGSNELNDDEKGLLLSEIYHMWK